MLSRPITRASHTGTGRTSNTFADTFDHCPGIMNQFTDKLGFSRYTLCKQDYGSFRMAYSHRNEAPAVGCALAGLGGELEDAAGLGADRASRNARL